MSMFYIERQCWQRFPKVLIMVKKNGHGDERRRYVPERTCHNVGAEYSKAGFECSECGAIDLDFVAPDFCHGCGARVVEEEK